MAGKSIGEEKVGGIGVTRRGFLGFLGGEMECGCPSIDTSCSLGIKNKLNRIQAHLKKAQGRSVQDVEKVGAGSYVS